MKRALRRRYGRFTLGTLSARRREEIPQVAFEAAFLGGAAALGNALLGVPGAAIGASVAATSLVLMGRPLLEEAS